MSPPVWCVDLADRFWAAAGPPPPFPRDLLGPASIGFPITILDRPRLSIASVLGWFAGRRIALPLDEPDRPLRACLVATHGQGFVFLDAADDPAERRFSLAHEIAHFLRDYWHPRETIIRRLGPAAREVLDGDRPPTPAERLQAILRHVSVRPFVHLLRRDESGRPLTPAESAAEAAADQLAFELLAPAELFVDHRSAGAVATCLRNAFGFPPGPAAAYAALLAPTPPPPDPFVGRLRKSC
ncbi:MAG: ImmA/IrrE family metallo-endopeptidase [Gemmataceae bacterium]|nr:ImmA/IrrE family metallo-endopeptidase [Gemmataceae bacterium]